MLREASLGLPRTALALAAVRLLLGVLANGRLLLRHQAALVSLLGLSAQVGVGEAPPDWPDWILRQQVDMLVGTAHALGERFDASLRKAVTEHLFPLALTDPWTHCRVAELLSMYQRPNFASSREEITSLSAMLNTGACEDEHHRWWRDLALTYLPTVQSKTYLCEVYRESKLGRRLPLQDAQVWAMPPPTPTPLETPVPQPPFAAPPAAVARTSWSDAMLTPSSDVADALAAVVPRGELARRILEAEDSLLAPDIGDRLRDYCSEGGGAGALAERTAEAVELLAANYRGYHYLSHLASRWVAAAGIVKGAELPARLPAGGTADGRSPASEMLLRNLLRRKMLADFDPGRADPLLGTAQMPGWLDPLIRVPEWRGVVYDLAKQYRGQA